MSDRVLSNLRNILSYYSKDIDADISLDDICVKVRETLSLKERVLSVLRLLEKQIPITEVSLLEIKDFSSRLDIKDEIFDSLVAFVKGDTSNISVKTLQYAGGELKTLLLSDFESLIFSYAGEENILYNESAVRCGSFLIWERSGILKSRSDKPLYYYNAMSLYNDSGSQKAPLKLRGNNINFRFRKGDGGIHDFTFNLYAGELVAIMGGSGTGKSTLLSILNGSISPQEGGITVNGHSLDEPGAKSLIGYVPQDDLLIAELTVYQNLLFTARLCFSGMSEEELDKKVMSMLRSLGLESSKDLKAGSAVNKYISGGQRKRLNIALELIREPDILYLDEPTSGLSSSDTLAVMNLLREQAYKGRLIIAIIHQPSSDVFKMFDRLWVLDNGGYPVYDGNPIEAVSYFRRAAGYPDAGVSVCPACGNVDSESILAVLNEKVISPDGSITERRKVSPQQWHELYLETAPKSKEKLEPLPESHQCRPGKFKQMLIFLNRNFRAKAADRQWSLIALLEAPFLALICSLLTHFAPQEGYSLIDNKNFVSYMFMAVIVAVFLGMIGSAEEIIKDRALLKREKFLHLSYGSYIFSKLIFMAVVSLVQTFLFIVCGNLIMGLHCLFLQWWLILFAVEMLSAIIGLLLSQWLRSVVSIYITIPILLIPQILLCGLVVDFNDLTPDSRTGNVPVIGDFIPSRWAFEALAVTTFTDNPYEKPFFDGDKARFEASYYDNVYLKVLQDSNDGSEEGLKTIRTSLPMLLEFCGLDSLNISYDRQSLKETFDILGGQLDGMITKENVRHYRALDSYAEEIGKSALYNLKRDNYNIALEEKLLNENSKSFSVTCRGQIVPRIDYVFLDPMTHNGRAHFYSSVKILGDLRIRTIWYNLLVMLLMGLVCSSVLLCDIPDKFKN